MLVSVQLANVSFVGCLYIDAVSEAEGVGKPFMTYYMKTKEQGPIVGAIFNLFFDSVDKVVLDNDTTFYVNTLL